MSKLDQMNTGSPRESRQPQRGLAVSGATLLWSACFFSGTKHRKHCRPGVTQDSSPAAHSVNRGTLMSYALLGLQVWYYSDMKFTHVRKCRVHLHCGRTSLTWSFPSYWRIWRILCYAHQWSDGDYSVTRVAEKCLNTFVFSQRTNWEVYTR